MKNPPTGHAVVIGGSIAGLVTARVLADTFEQVTVVDRDAFPGPGEQRKGVPQGRHAHGLLAQGLHILEDLFPGLTASLVGAGAHKADLGSKVLWHHEGYHCRYVSGLEGIVASRPFLEGHVRARLARLPNVRIVERMEAMQLLMNPSGERAVGVKVAMRDGDGSAHDLRADLVVDASGRGSRLPQWLTAAGYDAPEEDLVHVGLTYATRTYRRLPDDAHGDLAQIVAPSQHNRRGAALIATHDGAWTATLFGYFGDAPTSEANEFAEFARGLNCPDVHELLRRAQPLSDVTVYRFPAHRRQRYERLARFPERLLVLGDAVCSFNPIYGQGMTSACMQADVLRRLLPGGLDGIAARFFRAASEVVDGPWAIATGGDLRLPGVMGERTLAKRFVNWYVGRLHVAARTDPEVAYAFLKVANLMEPAHSVLKPAIAWRVLRGNLRPKRNLRVVFQPRSAMSRS